MPDSPLQLLARRISQTRPIDRAAKLALARELRGFRGRMLPGAGQDAIDRLEAAAMLMAFLASAEEVPLQALQTVARLTASLDERLFLAPAAPITALPLASGLEGLGPASRLGEILVHTGIVTQEQLAEALRMQSAWRLPLGACLERLGSATGPQIARALEFQGRLRASGSPAAPLASPPPASWRPELRLEVRERAKGPLLGELLVEQGTITPEQLEQGLRTQRAAGLRLGEALVQLGFLGRDQLRQALQLQERLRPR